MLLVGRGAVKSFPCSRPPNHQKYELTTDFTDVTDGKELDRRDSCDRFKKLLSYEFHSLHDGDNKSLTHSYP